MRSGISVTAGLKLTEAHQHIVFCLKAEFDTDDILLHSGGGNITVDSEVYEGAGTLLSMSDVSDDQELQSSNVIFALSGMNAEVLGYALTENYQNRPVTLKMAFLSGGTDHVIASFILYKGRMMQITVVDDPNGGSTITLSTENRLVDLRKPSNYRYTKESQNYLYSGDTALDGIAKLQDMILYWGRLKPDGVRDSEDDFRDTTRNCLTPAMLPEGLKVGDEVDSPTGKTKVTEIIYKQREGYYVLEDELEITSDHPILINGEWIRAEEYQGNKVYKDGDVEVIYVETENELLTVKGWAVSGKYQ